MFDFCYYANTLFIIFLMLHPQNDILFKSCFFFSNGALAIAVGAFRNQMVFHKMDNISSLAIHMLPQLATWNLRWHTMTREQNLPAEERKYVDLDLSFNFVTFFGYPIAIYLFWLFAYFMINFVIAKKRIANRNYENMYNYYDKQKWAHKLLNTCG